MDQKYDYRSGELAMQELWHTGDVYKTPVQKNNIFSVDTPPPTVSGSLHIGHIFSYTQTDIAVRYQRMMGKAVFYPFGFDDNGLPTERFVEKKLDKTARMLGRSAFIQACLEQTAVVEKQFEVLWRRMGLSVDWRACYSTISSDTRRISQKSFIELYQKGFIYRGQEPALYCTGCRTSVAQAELEDLERATTFNTIVFMAPNDQQVQIATTRPELLGACVALVCHPDDARYTHLQGKSVVVPLYNREVPVLCDELVQPDKGTGLVMICTFGDKTDVLWYKKFKLPYIQLIGQDGLLTTAAGSLVGMTVAKAREAIIEQLKTAGILVSQQELTQVTNIHDRCKRPIEYCELSQWFVKILAYRQDFLNCADKITWHPAFMKQRYIDWVSHLSWDWCISRQRYFGIPFPVWHCKACNKVLCAPMEMLPVDPQENAYPGVCPQCKSTDIVPDTDVMDTWNSSSLTPYICQELYAQVTGQNTEQIEFMPMALRPQAHDIIRTWAFDTIVKSWMHEQKVPWNAIAISGHVLSSEKQKISKSQGNAPLDPEKLLERYPADALRYWTASAGLGHDTAFSEEQIKVGSKLITKLWNGLRFVQEHTHMLTKEERTDALTHEPEMVINRWITHQGTHCWRGYTESLNQYEINGALLRTERFFWHDFCDNYLEIIKDLFFNSANYAPKELADTRYSLYAQGLRILQLYAPYVPHVTEQIYQAIYADVVGIKSLHLTLFGPYQHMFEDAQAQKVVEVLMAVIAQVRRAKTEAQLSLRNDISQLIITGEAGTLLKAIEPIVRGITRAQKIVYESGSEFSVTVIV